MKKFEATRRNSIDGKWYNIKRTDFVYDGKPGSYYKMWDDKVNSHCIIYDDHDCIWSIKHGPLGRFGRMFDVPKYQEFIDYVGILFNIEVPTITYDTDDLVIYNSTPPSEPDKRGIVKIVYQFIFNGIHGKYTQYKTDYKIENVIEYDGLKSVVVEWIIDSGLEYQGDCFPLPKYSDFVSQFKSTFVLSLPTVNKPDDNKIGAHSSVKKNLYDYVTEIYATDPRVIQQVDLGEEIDISTVNKPDTDKLVITDTNTRKNLAKNPNDDDYIETVKKFMYKGKEGKCTNVIFGILTENAIEYDNFKTVITEYHHDDGSVRCDINGDRYILPENSNFVNQIKDAFGVELPTVKREPNKIIILNKTHTCERDIYYTSYKFEFNGKPGTCLIRVGDDINATRITYDGEDKEWGRYYGEWDCTSYTFTDPKYNDFKKAAKEAFGIYDFPDR